MPTATRRCDLRALSEQYLPGSIERYEYEEAVEQAKRKLARIIEREGDADGERRKPYYLAQLIAEAVRAERFSVFTKELYDLYRYADEQIQQRKKEMPATEAARQI